MKQTEFKKKFKELSRMIKSLNSTRIYLGVFEYLYEVNKNCALDVLKNESSRWAEDLYQWGFLQKLSVPVYEGCYEVFYGVVGATEVSRKHTIIPMDYINKYL